MTSNSTIAAALSSVYGGNIDLCELYVCGLAEDHIEGANLGPTFQRVIREQYIRIRDGDRFWFENSGMFTEGELRTIQDTSLSKIILRNTDIQTIQCAVFFTADSCINSKNGTTGSLTTGVAVTTTSTTTGAGVVPDFVVNVQVKTNAHPTYGLGTSEYGYILNGTEGPPLTLVRGREYLFRIDGKKTKIYRRN